MRRNVGYDRITVSPIHTLTSGSSVFGIQDLPDPFVGQIQRAWPARSHEWHLNTLPGVGRRSFSWRRNHDGYDRPLRQLRVAVEDHDTILHATVEDHTGILYRRRGWIKSGLEATMSPREWR